MKYNKEKVISILDKFGVKLLENDYINCKQKMLCIDSEGYKLYITLDSLINKGKMGKRFHKSNNYTIYNINRQAELNGLTSRCIATSYENSKQKLPFRCECGNTFYTTRNNFAYFHKIKCDNCTGYHCNTTYEEIKNNLKSKGYYLVIKETEFHGITKTKLTSYDNDGYKFDVVYDAVMNGKIHNRFDKSNKYTIYNINHFLKLNAPFFECISKEFLGANFELEFLCKRCGEQIYKAWKDVYKNDNPNRHRILCPNCDGRTESVHALVLKQMFKHYYHDTIEEEKSCRNPLTNKIMPTDIVNHRLKIAIEIQSEWHDNKYSNFKDNIKKNFWLSKGYKFYDPDIRDYSVLEMCQLFFDINEIPDYINFSYSNKINIKEIQSMLNKQMKIGDIASNLNINIHRIYDAIYANKLKRPEKYLDGDLRPIVQLDENGNLIGDYDSISLAGKATGLNSASITSALARGSNYALGFYWFDRDDYLSGKFEIKQSRFSKFNIPVNVYQKDNTFICTYRTIFDASKEFGINNYSILRVINGDRKSAKGYIFRKA